MPAVESQTRVLITGAHGFVGQAVAQQLRQSGWVLFTPTRHELDLTDAGAIETYLQQYQPDVIIHCAGKVGGIQANIDDPTGFLLDNMLMGFNLVRAARQLQIPRFINLGSSCMYPRNYTGELTESALLAGSLEPTNEGYALAKIAVCRLCESITTDPENALQYKTLIPCNLYGPNDPDHPERSHLVIAALTKIRYAHANGDKTVTIWHDGTARRECLFVHDLAQCIERALHHFDSLPGVMNVGPGVDITVNELYQTIADCVGYRGTFVHDMTRPQGMTHKCLSVQRMKAWGWEPPTSLVDGIKQTLNHYSQRETIVHT